MSSASFVRAPFLTGLICWSLTLGACAQEGEERAAEAPSEGVAAATVSAARAVDEAPDGAWSLDPAASRISFISIKAGEIAEIHRFRKVEGRVAPDGSAEIIIPLDSVETNIDIRNERMREMLFETADYPRATITGAFDLDAYRSLAAGERIETDAVLTLDLHGVEGDLNTSLFVTRLGPDRISVETVAPIVVEASAFDLGEGVEALREVAGLPTIAPLAPVTASLVFQRAD